MFGFLKKKPKASEDTALFFACVKAESSNAVRLGESTGKTQADKFRERYKGVDPFKKSEPTPPPKPKRTKGKLNSTKKKEKTIHSLADLDIFGN